MRALLLLLGLVVGEVFAGPIEEKPAPPVSWNADLALDAIVLPHRPAIEWNFESSLAFEADLGPLLDLDDFYLYVRPTLTWGVENAHQWSVRLYQAWLSWDAGARWNWLVGLYDVGWHFHALPSAAVFNRLPGRNTGSFSPGSLGLLDLFPLSAPAVRIEWKPTENFAVQTAVVWLGAEYNLAVHRLAPDLAASHGWLGLAEVVWEREGLEANGFAHRRFGIGAWGMPVAQLENSGRTPLGGYAFADIRVWSERDQPEEGVAVFASISVANHRSGAPEKRAVGGFYWLGLFPHRPADGIALAVITEDSAATAGNAGNASPRRWRSAAQILHRIPIGDSASVESTLLWSQPSTADSGGGGWKIGITLGVGF